MTLAALRCSCSPVKHQLLNLVLALAHANDIEGEGGSLALVTGIEGGGGWFARVWSWLALLTEVGSWLAEVGC